MGQEAAGVGLGSVWGYPKLDTLGLGPGGCLQGA